MIRFIFTFLGLFFLLSSLSGQTRKDSLYVFVGEKIEVKEWPQPATIETIDTTIINGDTTISKKVSLSMDSRFIAKYKILQKVYGTFKTDTIEFLVFDHYGVPAFSKYKYSLLFVSNYNGALYHEKHQYYDVYKTKNGHWAGSYIAKDYDRDYNKNTVVKPEVIDFVSEVSYKIKGLSKEDIRYLFPSPYFKISRGKAIAVWGNYVEELLELKESRF